MTGSRARLAAAAMTLALAAAPPPAGAHGEAEWIREGGFRAPLSGEWCCGPTDCEVVPTPDVVEDRDGWTIVATGERIPRREAMPSRDGRFWRCHRPDGSRRCFFYPPGVS